MSKKAVGHLIAGKLLEHGRAYYRFQSDQDLSYYVKLLTSTGKHTVWGKDLDRALSSAETRPKIGDLVGVRLSYRERFTRTEPLHDQYGQGIGRAEHKAYRNRWEVEKIAYFGKRATLARRVREVQAETRLMMRLRPELKSSYLSIRAAAEFAQRRIADPKDREQFVEFVKGAIAGSIRQGEPVPEVKIKEAALKTMKTQDNEPTR
jgi:hypothetical protein